MFHPGSFTDRQREMHIFCVVGVNCRNSLMRSASRQCSDRMLSGEGSEGFVFGAALSFDMFLSIA
jgi:hypothetical protein